MSTRSLVAMKLAKPGADGSEEHRCIYIHFDGYPDGIGAELLKHYTTTRKVKALIAEGDHSSIYEGVATSYRSRGEDCPADLVDGNIRSLMDYARTRWVEWLYVWDEAEGGWTTREL